MVMFRRPYVTRAEAAMLLLLSRIPSIPPIETDQKFPDLKPDAWYWKYIIVAERFGILSANQRTKQIRPEAPVTRAEFLKMLTLTFGLPQNLPFSYIDVPPKAWFAAHAGIAEEHKLFGANGAGKLFPGRLITHLEAAEAVQALLIATGQSIHDLQSTTADASTLQTTVTLTNTRFLERNRPRPISSRSSVSSKADDAATTKLRARVIELVNIERKKIKQQTLKENTMLNHSAQRYAEDMERGVFFAHVTPDGQTLKDRIQESGYYDPFFALDCLCVRRYALGENLAQGHQTADDVVSAWMNSPAHRRTLLFSDFADIGIGISGNIWVEHFGGIQ